MKGDFTRDTFEPENHYQQVLMQQGRVQLDADWNEQAAIAARRDKTTAKDMVGCCGGPADNAAFGIVTDPAKLSGVDYAALRAWVLAHTGKDLGVAAPKPLDRDFILTRGRYYVDGIQCELEHPVLFSAQPDRLDTTHGLGTPAKDQAYLIFLDVWHRHITSLDDPGIREPALGGPDTATRVKAVWQVRAGPLLPGDLNAPCTISSRAWGRLVNPDPRTARLTADTVEVAASDKPCQVPETAGYKGLENQLYRVEIHDPGSGINAADAGTKVVLGDTKSQITVSGGSWQVGQRVEIFCGNSGASLMHSQLAWITAVVDVNGTDKKLTLSTPIANLTQNDNPHLRTITRATWKWSRENGSVVAEILRINGKEITLATLGPDDRLGFHTGDWVEILDDALELEGKPGQLAQIADPPDVATRTLTLTATVVGLAPQPPASPAIDPFPNGVMPERHPKLRRWEGVAAVKYSTIDEANWLPLENGVRVRFDAGGDYRTGHYWQIPARAATATAPAGDIEWPRELDTDGKPDSTKPLSLPPCGIVHHYCRLGTVTLNENGTLNPTATTDCRCLWPALTTVPRLFYVSGDGQEVMPVPGQRLAPLPHPLQVSVGIKKCSQAPSANVQFVLLDKMQGDLTGDNVSKGTDSNGNVRLVVSPNPEGIAGCSWSLDASNWNDPKFWTQQAEARLLDTLGNPLSPPIRFNASLSIASQVACDPQNCLVMQADKVKTVQEAIDSLCRHAGSGCEMAVSPNEQLNDVVARLLGQSQFDIRLCLMPGDHTLRTWDVDVSRLTNLTITGGGQATRLSIQCSVTLTGLNSFTLRDVDVTLDDGLTFTLTECGHVEVSGCYLSGTATTNNPLLLIDRAGRVSVRGNVMEMSKGTELMPVRVLQEKFLVDLFEARSRREFSQLVADSAQQLAALKSSDRATLSTLVNARMQKFASGMSQAEAATYARFLGAAAVEKPDPRVLADRLQDMRTAAIGAAPGVALVIGGDATEVTVTDNDIAGVTSFYGVPGTTPLDEGNWEANWKVLLTHVRQGLFGGLQSEGSLQVHTNRLSRVTLGEVIIQSIQGLSESNSNGKWPVIHTEAFFSRNVIELGGNLFLAKNYAFTTNYFEAVDVNVVGYVCTDTAIYLGNSASSNAGLAGLRNCSRVPPMAANLLLRIETV